jgi:tetratricopeptide (TPR) repeat protein
MLDVHLNGLLHGAFNKTENSTNKRELTALDRAINSEVEKYLDQIDFNADEPNLKLQTPQMKRAQKRIEIRGFLEFAELNNQIARAVRICKDEGLQFLSNEEYSSLIEDFAAVEQTSQDIDFVKEPAQNLKESLQIKDQSCEALILIANGMYKANRYDDCLAVLGLLLSLEPDVADYWYRVGVTAQQCQNFEFAVKAYLNAYSLDSSLFGALLFTADCYLSLGLIPEALATCEEAKAVMQLKGVEAPWDQLLINMEQLINSQQVRH